MKKELIGKLLEMLVGLIRDKDRRVMAVIILVAILMLFFLAGCGATGFFLAGEHEKDGRRLRGEVGLKFDGKKAEPKKDGAKEGGDPVSKAIEDAKKEAEKPK